MTVSLGGGRGPDNGGSNPLGGRPVQRGRHRGPGPARAGPRAGGEDAGDDGAGAGAEVAHEAAEGDAATAGREDGARGSARAESPSAGPKRSSDASFAETGVSGLGLGLATGGAGTGSSLDVGNFCCPDYLRIMTRRITENWNSKQGVSGVTVMRFTILRDGRITDIGVEQSAGYVLDLTAQRALQRLGQLPPLPSGVHVPDADRLPEIRVSTLMRRTTCHVTLLAVCSCGADDHRARRADAPGGSAGPAAAGRVADHHRRAGRPPALRRAGLHRAVERRRDRRGGDDCSARCCGTT